MARAAGASAAVVMGGAPVETVNAFIKACTDEGIDSYVDMMNVEYPVKVMRLFPKQPTVVLLHRGVDEETFNRSKPIPYIQINKVRANYTTMIGIAGGDTIREVQRAIFNSADIVVVWKEFYAASGETAALATEFLKQIK
jgi:bifunctional enzyme Fae/Hps